MRSRTAWSGRRSRQAGLALILLVLLSPLAGELGHGSQHVAAGPIVHDEAAHPDAAVHLEQEVHDREAKCPACLHGGHKATEATLAATWVGRPESDDRLAAMATPVELARFSHSPRAPPA